MNKNDMLEINVAQLLKSSIGTSKELLIDACIDITSFGLCAVKGSAKLLRTNRSILVTGKMTTSIKTICSRCLVSIECPLVLDIEEEFYPITDVNSGIPTGIADEPDDFIIDDHLILDIGEAVRQYALLAIPMKPLCNIDCPGLSHYNSK